MPPYTALTAWRSSVNPRIRFCSCMRSSAEVMPRSTFGFCVLVYTFSKFDFSANVKRLSFRPQNRRMGIRVMRAQCLYCPQFQLLAHWIRQHYYCRPISSCSPCIWESASSGLTPPERTLYTFGNPIYILLRKIIAWCYVAQFYYLKMLPSHTVWILLKRSIKMLIVI